MPKIIILGLFASSFFLSLMEFVNMKFSRKFKKIIFDLFFLVLILVSALKTNETSFDTNNYVNHFINADPINNFSFLWYGWEPGFVLLNSLIKTFSNNYHVFFFVLTSIVLYLYRSIIFRYSNHIFLSLFTYVSCYFFLNEIVIIRFGLASAIVFYNIKNIVEGNKKKALLTVLLATMFHYTSIVTIIPVLLYRKENQKNLLHIYACIFLFMSVIFLLMPPLTMVAHLASVVNENLGNILWRVLRYQGFESSGSLKRIIIYFPFLLLLIIYFKNSFFQSCFSENKQQVVFVEILYLFSAIFFMITCRQVASLARLNAIFLPIIILSGENILQPCYKKDPFKYFYFLWIYLFNTYIFFRAIFFNSGGSINLT
ncbi:MAG: EpsG family protein [Treponema sp.]|nr:EpsG family protein [Treponema sp.]